MSYREEVSLSGVQRAVLFDDASRVLVAAGAGSGKTLLLVSYFVHVLLDEGVPLEDLAAVTFTRKAGELCIRDIGDSDKAAVIEILKLV